MGVFIVPPPQHLIMAWDIISSAAGPLVSLGAGSESKMTWAQGLIHIWGGQERGVGAKMGGVGAKKRHGEGGPDLKTIILPPKLPATPQVPPARGGVHASVSPGGQCHGGVGGIWVVPPSCWGGPQCVSPLPIPPRGSPWCVSPPPYLEVGEDRHDLDRGDARFAVVLRDLGEEGGHRRGSGLCPYPPKYPGGVPQNLPSPLTAFWASSKVFSMAAIWLSRSL